MADSGLSGQLPLRRLKEVTRAYHHAFGLFWWFPLSLDTSGGLQVCLEVLDASTSFRCLNSLWSCA